MQVELPSDPHWRTRVELAHATVVHLGVFYNNQRRLSALCMLPPIAVETLHQSVTAG